MSQACFIRHICISYDDSHWEKSSAEEKKNESAENETECPTEWRKTKSNGKANIIYENEIALNATTCGCILYVIINLQETHLFFLFFHICSCCLMFANKSQYWKYFVRHKINNKQPLPFCICHRSLILVPSYCVCVLWNWILWSAMGNKFIDELIANCRWCIVVSIS